MEATSSCETLVSSYPITRHHIPEDRISLHQEWSYRILLVDNLPTISPESGNSMKMGVKNAAFLNDSSGELFRKWNQTASWHILITNLMHWLLFIHKILFSSTCFEPLVLIFRRIQLYTCSIWYCHSLREFVVVCRYTAWVRTDGRGRLLVGRLKTPYQQPSPTVSSHSSCVPTDHHELS